MPDPPDQPLLPEIALPSLALQTLLTETGVREFIICAGARNSALLVMLAAIPVLAAWRADGLTCFAANVREDATVGGAA